MRNLNRRIERWVGPSRDIERLDVLHSDTYTQFLQLLSLNHPTNVEMPYQIGVVANGWYDSRVTRQQIIELKPTDMTLAIASLVSKPCRVGTGDIQRIAVMEIDSGKILILEQPAQISSYPLWAFWRIPEISNPPTIVELKKDPFPKDDRVKFRDIDSGFASLAEIRKYRQLAVGALQRLSLTIPV